MKHAPRVACCGSGLPLQNAMSGQYGRLPGHSGMVHRINIGGGLQLSILP